MQKQIKVYLASKVCHAQRWLVLRTEWPEAHITSRWPAFVAADHGEDETKISPNRAMQFWQDDLEDVRASDVVLVYSEYTKFDEHTKAILESGWSGEKCEDGVYEKLRGALVEAGMGLALGKRVIVVGDAPDYGTWQHHPLCLKVSDLAEARIALQLIFQHEDISQETLRQLLLSRNTHHDF